MIKKYKSEGSLRKELIEKYMKKGAEEMFRIMFMCRQNICNRVCL